MGMTTEQLTAEIQKGVFKPHLYLTNVCLAYFQSMAWFVAKKVFPIVPVPTSSAHYYEFDKGDLARDNMARKPEFGHVAPGIYGKRDKHYHCEVDQVITGVDQISSECIDIPGLAGVLRQFLLLILLAYPGIK